MPNDTDITITATPAQVRVIIKALMMVRGGEDAALAKQMLSDIMPQVQGMYEPGQRTAGIQTAAQILRSAGKGEHGPH